MNISIYIYMHGYTTIYTHSLIHICMERERFTAEGEGACEEALVRESAREIERERARERERGRKRGSEREGGYAALERSSCLGRGGTPGLPLCPSVEAELSPMHPRSLCGIRALELRAKRETTGYEPFAVHAPIEWAIQGNVIKGKGGSNVRVGRVVSSSSGG